MACALTPESRRLYSWWWDSHISPKNSRWLQENLTDMDTKVKSMIKLIEEDADSFARRAEMYYKKRPELMKLVEQFYRAYRALAERYDHATNELRHAQKALQAAFPDQEPFTFPEDSSSSIEPDAIKHESFGLQLFGEDECEVERLKKVVADLIAEKDSLYVLYQYSLGKLANADEELACARERSRILEEKGNEAGKEVHKLKETLGVTNQTEHLATITDLKEKINTLDKRALAGLKYREMTSVLEKTIVVTEEMEVEKLKAALLELTEEKEVLRVLYAECLEKSYVLERDLSLAQSDVQRLTTEIVNSSEKLKHVEEICVHLETSNQYLKMEVSDLAKKIMFQDQELSDKHDELKNTEVEVVALQRMKERLEEEVVLKSGQFTAMQKEIFDLKEEITKLNVRSNSLTVPLELTCLNPESVEDENSRLITDLQSSCESLHVEKSNFILEKSILSSQLHVTTINMQTLLDQKTVLENSLSAANIELENLRERSKGLEELCELLKNEKSNLFVESVQKRLEVLENRFMQFEKEKETGNSRMLELVSSTVKKQEHKNQIVMSQKRLDDLENKLKKAEFQDELDKAVIAQFENFILHKFVLEVEEENYCLSVENRKHIEASKLADNLISELEREILEQQVEEELLLVEVENLRSGINKVFLSLGIGSNPAKISTEEIMDNIMDLKHCLLKEENIKHRLLIENNVISTFLMNKYEAMKDDLFKIKKENLDLIEVNENLGLELVILDEEIEERETVQQNLASELQEREKELEVSKSEAAKLIFDLQVSNTRDIVFESKVHELAAFCESLKGESAAKDLEIEEMKRKASIMEKEIEGLKAQLLAYTPVIGSLKENISSLEQNFFAVANLVVSNSRKAQDVELKVHPHHNQRDPEVTRGRKSFEPNGISDLIEFQTRIAALEKVIEKDINTAARCKTSAINFKQKPAKPETEESKSNDHQKRNKEEKIHRKQRYLTLDPLNISDVRDIPLDQASDGSSSAKSRSRSRRGYLRSDGMLIEQLQASRNSSKRYANKLPYEPQIEDLSIYRLPPSNQEHKKVKLLQRLASDAHKLENLESTVKDLTKRLEAGKRSKKQNGVDLKIVKEQLEQAEETISHLANVNIESTANVEKNTSLAAWLEQDDPWKRSERIKTVQLDVQNIQCVLMKLDDEKKCKMKSRFSMSKSRTSVILRDFIHHGGRSRRRRLCGCFTPSLSKSDHVKS